MTPNKVQPLLAVLLALCLGVASCSSDGNGTNDAAAPESPGSTAGPEGAPAAERTVADEPAAEVTGPIEGGARGVAYNPMPAGLADESGYLE